MDDPSRALEELATDIRPVQDQRLIMLLNARQG